VLLSGTGMQKIVNLGSHVLESKLSENMWVNGLVSVVDNTKLGILS
jgi:hypothetical protein